MRLNKTEAMNPLAEKAVPLLLRLHNAIYQRTDGRIGHHFPPLAPSLLLHSVGAKTGVERTASLSYARDGDDYLVVASKGGDPKAPGWYHNLKANPVAKVEVGAKDGTETFEVRAHEADGEERKRIYADRVAIAPGFGEYERQTSRQIPVMILERTR
jgi:F420H(2)-dependent quinone reductase